MPENMRIDVRPLDQLTPRELEMSVRLSQAERKCSDLAAALFIAELRAATLEGELEKLTRAGFCQRWLAKNWWK